MIPPEQSPFLTIWVIYRNPRDYPGKYVTRAQHVVRGQTEPVIARECTVHDSLAAAREAVPRFQEHVQGGRTYASEYVRMDRHPEDDPTIVETWI